MKCRIDIHCKSYRVLRVYMLRHQAMQMIGTNIIVIVVVVVVVFVTVIQRMYQYMYHSMV